MKSLHLSRRLLLGAALSAILGGCSSDNQDWVSLLQSARQAWVNRDAPVGLNEAAAVPFATLGIRIDGGREQILVLATDSDGERLWTSGAHVAITTRGDRIVRTAGFGTDLSAVYSVSGERDLRRVSSSNRVADFRDIGRFGISITCKRTVTAYDPITILGKQFETTRIEEVCNADAVGWAFTNVFWISEKTGRVWRSIQHIHPKGPALELEILRPPLSFIGEEQPNP